MHPVTEEISIEEYCKEQGVISPSEFKKKRLKENTADTFGTYLFLGVIVGSITSLALLAGLHYIVRLDPYLATVPSVLAAGYVVEKIVNSIMFETYKSKKYHGKIFQAFTDRNRRAKLIAQIQDVELKNAYIVVQSYLNANDSQYAPNMTPEESELFGAARDTIKRRQLELGYIQDTKRSPELTLNEVIEVQQSTSGKPDLEEMKRLLAAGSQNTAGLEELKSQLDTRDNIIADIEAATERSAQS